MINIKEISSNIDIGKIVHFESVDSTNKIGRELALKGNDKFLVIAEKQHSGRGRFKRKWYSNTGGLYISIGMNINSFDFPPQLLSIVCAMSVIEAIKKRDILPTFKWPNDVLINEKKISGILLELINNIAICGIGINVNNCLDEISLLATSMNEETGIKYSIEGMIIDIINNLEKIKNDKELIYNFLKNSDMNGKNVTVNTINKCIKGKVKGISDNGELVIETENGSMNIIEGDIKMEMD